MTYEESLRALGLDTATGLFMHAAQQSRSAKIADILGDHQRADSCRREASASIHKAKQLRTTAHVVAAFPDVAPRRTAPRSRGRREHRVAQATSSASSGEPALDVPAFARAIRAEVEARTLKIPERCMCCETVGRLVVLGVSWDGPGDDFATVQCTVCWCEFDAYERRP